MKHSSSMSDGISLLNSDNSLTNLPMFSDYVLHKMPRILIYNWIHNPIMVQE